MNQIIEELKSKTFKVGSDGFIRLVDVMGTDQSIVQAARVSYGAGTRKTSDDENLINYLMRNRHTTPFEMCEVKVHIRIPMDSWRQWVRHRTASINEYSTRYSEAINSMESTPASEWRKQSTTNKQGSGENFTLEEGEIFSIEEKRVQTLSRSVYENRLIAGVAREQARKDLPLSTYTEAYWKCDLHNIFHFLGLRMDSHAQLEIREYAEALGEEIVAPLFPLAWAAFKKYRLEAMSLSSLDIQAFRIVLGKISVSDFGQLDKIVAAVDSIISNKRELSEFVEKWKRLVGYDELSDFTKGL
jgi:thymidylate synthase (FAD)